MINECIIVLMSIIKFNLFLYLIIKKFEKLIWLRLDFPERF